MRIINLRNVEEGKWESPKGKFGCHERELSIALGLDLDSHDSRRHHPFDVMICRIPPGRTNWPNHSHSAQWEFYHVLSGSGEVRHGEGVTKVSDGDAFIFAPDEAHQIKNSGTMDMVVCIVANNPVGESCFYPDSNKWHIRDAKDQIVRSEPIDYLDGEE